MQIKGEDWFKHYAGFEEYVKGVYENMVLTENDGFCQIQSKINGKTFNCGKFTIRTIDSFNLEPIGNGKLHIICGKGRYSKRMDLVDVLQMQNNPDFNGATFLAASNFNCLEFPSAKSRASHGIRFYAVDVTQGPTLSIASFGAILYRNYFLPYGKTQENVDDEINLLDSTPIFVNHGKACLSTDEEMKLVENFDFSNENLYKIGVHKNVEVTTNRLQQFNYIDAKPDQYVHQVFAASFALGSYVARNERNLEILSEILFYEYKLTILAAWENSLKYPDRAGSKKCVLTTLGMGVFNNPPEIVGNAISKCKDLILESGLDVYVVCFSDNNRDGFGAIYPHLKDAIESTQGTVIYA